MENVFYCLRFYGDEEVLADAPIRLAARFVTPADIHSRVSAVGVWVRQPHWTPECNPVQRQKAQTFVFRLRVTTSPLGAPVCNGGHHEPDAPEPGSEVARTEECVTIPNSPLTLYDLATVGQGAVLEPSTEYIVVIEGVADDSEQREAYVGESNEALFRWEETPYSASTKWACPPAATCPPTSGCTTAQFDMAYRVTLQPVDPCDDTDPGCPTLGLDTNGDVASDELPSYSPQGATPSATWGSNALLFTTIADPQPQETVRFNLANPTNYDGDAMNGDFSKSSLDIGLADTGAPHRFATDPMATAELPIASTAVSVPLRVTDWAATVEASVTRSSNGMTRRIRIPLDTHETCTDLDTNVGSPHVGDGLTAWEEYRGFYMQGQHTRTDPAVKDLFVFADTFDTSLVTQLPIGTHFIAGTEFTGRHKKRRVINAFRPGTCPGGGVLKDQKAVVVLHDTFDALVFAQVHPPKLSVFQCYPNTVEYISIYDETIRQHSPPTFDRCGREDADIGFTRVVVAHEVGHSIGISHYNYLAWPALHPDCSPESPTCGPSSLMVEGIGQFGVNGAACVYNQQWGRPTCDACSAHLPACSLGQRGKTAEGNCQLGTAPFWTNLPVGYDPVDGQFIQVRKP